MPIIASLNGESHEGWVEYAAQMQQAGASALELNVYFVPTDPEQSGSEVEQRYLDVLSAVKRVVTIPVAVKLGPFFSAFAHLARRLERAGADALVLFNRFCVPDIDLERHEVVTQLQLSDAREMGVPLLWLAVLRGQLRASLAATSGVQSEREIIKYLMAGADVTMTASALLRHGPDYLASCARGFCAGSRDMTTLPSRS